jgi:hypothetical protein
VELGDVDSVLGALRAAPQRLLAHGVRNLEALPEALLRLVGSSYAYATPLHVLLYGGLALWLLAGIALGPAAWARRALARAREVPRPAAVVLLASPIGCAGTLLASARQELLFPAFALLALPLGIAVAAARPLPARGARAAALVLPVALGIAALAGPGPHPRARQDTLVTREAVELCRSYLPARGARLLADFGESIAFLAEPQVRAEGRSPAPGASFEELLGSSDPTHLLCAPGAAWWSSFALRGLAEAMDRAPGSLGREYVSAGGVVLIDLRGAPGIATAKRRPLLRVIEDRATTSPAPGRALSLVAEGLPPGAHTSLLVDRGQGAANAVLLRTIAADAAGTARFDLVLERELGTRLALRAVAVRGRAQLTVTPLLEHTVGK